MVLATSRNPDYKNPEWAKKLENRWEKGSLASELGFFSCDFDSDIGFRCLPNRDSIQIIEHPTFGIIDRF